MHPMNNAVGLSGRPLFSLLFAAVLVIVITFQPASAFLPLQCVSNVTKPHAICCPRHPTNGKVCGGSKMGSCDRIIAPIEYVPTVFHVDDRAAWPTRFFSYACQCRGNFFGPACETCWFGWKGRLCDQRHMLTRKDIRRLSDFELKVFIDVVSRSRTWPSGYAILDESDNWHSDPLNNPNFEEASIQYFITFNHRYGSRTTLYKNVEDCEMYGILDFNHDGLTFPTWHRYFLLIWERMLGQIANKVYGITDFALPYWDWIGMRECDICNNRYIGAPGRRDSMGLHISERHPFHNMTEFCYEPEDGMLCYGCQKAQTVGKIVREWNSLDFPTQDNFEFTMSRRHYFVPGERDSNDCNSFHMALEGFCGEPGSDGSMLWTHNKIHNMIDGSMCCTATASNDPIFILHHGLMDKVFNVVRSCPCDHATVVGAGITLFEALTAADQLAKEGINIRVIDPFTIKPIDETLLVQAAKDTFGRIVVVEDHAPEGGIGEAVMSCLAKSHFPHVVIHLAVREVPRSGRPEELLSRYKINASSIIEAVKSLIDA